jgi:hypothetical protein
MSASRAPAAEEAAPGRRVGRRFVFVAGVHRSGTSMLAGLVAAHPDVSAFENTGAPQDEGAHLQRVYPDPINYGRTGRFGFQREARLTERSPLVTERNRERLFADWSRFWDVERPLLLEKSPTNIVKLRFLQAMFPDSSLLAIMRHPIPVACATQRWNRMRPHQLVRHWLRCHELLARDVPHLRRLHVVRYEDLVAAPDATLRRVYRFLGLDGEPPPAGVRSGRNEAYLATWERRREHPVKRAYLAAIEHGLERRVRRFGYSLLDPARIETPSVPLPGLSAERPLSGRAA